MATIKPAPCLIISADTSIGDTIELMRTHSASYVLLRDSQEKLSGIFTDRDVLTKFPILVDPDVRKKPVSTVATKPVKTLSIDLIHTVGEFMLKHNLRHIPVLEPGKEGMAADKIVGIVTSHSIFESVIRSRGGLGFYDRHRGVPSKVLGILSGDGSLFFQMQKLFEGSPYFQTERLYYANLRKPQDIKAAGTRCHAILIDVDDTPEREWADLLREFNASPQLDVVCLIYTPSAHSSSVNDLIQKLKVSGQFLVYEKPLDMTGMMLDLEKSWDHHQQTAT